MTGAPEPRPSLDAELVGELPRLREFVRRLLGTGAAGADVDDVLQDVAARAWRYRARFRPQRALGPWLRGVALRVVLDHRRRLARGGAPGGESVEALESRHSAEPIEQRDQLARLLEPLSAVERDVLTRFHGRGESTREIAAALALPEGTVKSHLHRARRKLAERASRGDGR